MLNKLKVIAFVGLVLSALRLLFPDFDIPAEFDSAVEALISAVFVIVAVVSGWLTSESQALVNKLKFK